MARIADSSRIEVLAIVYTIVRKFSTAFPPGQKSYLRLPLLGRDLFTYVLCTLRKPAYLARLYSMPPIKGHPLSLERSSSFVSLLIFTHTPILLLLDCK